MQTTQTDVKLDSGQSAIITQENELAVLKKYEKAKKVRGQLIEKLASEVYYVNYSNKIKDLVDDFNKMPETQVVGVVGEDEKYLGIIVRKQLFNMIAKPFGKDIIENKTIKEVIENDVLGNLVEDVTYYYIERNIFSVVEDLKPDLESKDLIYFVLCKNDREFAGIFTNIDVLFYLSSITQEDLKTAKMLQQTIVKQHSYMEEKRFRFVGGSSMAKGVGGDFYVIKQIPDTTRWSISLCDVSGKGVSAALVTAVLGGLFNIYNFNQSYSNFIKKMNEYILSSFNMEKYLTGVFIKFDDKTGKVKLFDMGHAYVYVYRDKGLYKFKTHENNVPIGFVPEIDPVANQFTLKKGDILFTLTDGINEQPNAEGSEYGLSRMLEIIEKNKADNFENIVKEVFADLNDFRGFYPQHDDMTIILFQYLGD